MLRLIRVFAVLLCCAAAAAAVPVRAEPTCSSPADESVYDVFALRTMMILLATKCGDDQDYNKAFIIRFQPALQQNEREVLAYFRRIYGGSGQTRKDAFSTDLVNVMSQQANTQGAQFCPRALWIISEMNALTSLAELPLYAAAKDLSPVGMSMCPAEAARAPARHVVRRAGRHR